MLIRRDDLEAIRAGRITQAYRRWKRPTVKAGGSLRTAIGVLAIDAVERTELAAIRDTDARAAGIADAGTLRGLLEGREGDVYRIRLSFAGADPRVALRERADLSDAETDELKGRLRRFDAASRRGAWTRATLAAIRQHPHLRAADLAASLDQERAWLKGNVRKLKNLGLTVSHSPGYELSPRGRSLLERLDTEDAG